MALVAQQAPCSFFGATRVSRVAASRPAVSRNRTSVVRPQALFGFGAKKEAADTGAAPQYYICIDCGFIYDQGDFKKAPGSYKCPVCSSPKSRFKIYKGAVKGKPNNSGSAMKQRYSAKQW